MSPEPVDDWVRLAVPAAAVVGSILTLILQWVLRRLNTSEEREATARAELKTAATEAARTLRIAAVEVRAALGQSQEAPAAFDQLPTCRQIIAHVRDDGVAIVAAEDEGLGSQLFLAHEAALSSLDGAVDFLERAVALDRLDEEDYGPETAVILEDVEDAIRDYLTVLNLALRRLRASRKRRSRLRRQAA